MPHHIECVKAIAKESELYFLIPNSVMRHCRLSAVFLDRLADVLLTFEKSFRYHEFPAKVHRFQYGNWVIVGGKLIQASLSSIRLPIAP